MFFLLNIACFQVDVTKRKLLKELRKAFAPLLFDDVFQV